MRKSKFASSCLYISLATVLLNIIAIILFKETSIQLETISLIYILIVLLSVAAVIGCIVSIVRVAISKKQLKGMTKSITAIVLSILMSIAGFVQLVFVQATISVRDLDIGDFVVDADYDDYTEEEKETTDRNIPEFVKKDFDVVAVADYYGELDKVGYIDKEGDFVIEPKFDDAKDFYEGLAPAKLDGKWGYIDKTGEFVIHPQFDRADIFSSGVAAVEVDDKWGYIDKTGEFIILPSQDKPTRFVEGLASFVSEENGKVGYKDTTGNFVIEPEYDYVDRYFVEGYAFVSKDISDIFSSRGFIDREGNFTSMEVESLGWTAWFSEGLYPICKEGNELWGYIDNTGEYIIEPKFSKCSVFSEGFADVIFPDGDNGYIDRDGNVIVKSKFHLTYPFSEGLALVNIDILSDNACGYIDKTGNYVIEPQFIYANSFSEGLALVNIKEKGWGFIDKTGKFVIGPIEYASFGRFHRVDRIFDLKKAESDELKIK